MEPMASASMGAAERYLILSHLAPSLGGMVFSADHYSSRQCAKARHNEELQECNTTYLHFDSYMLGAGSNACGPVPSKSNKRSTLKGEHIRLLVEFV